MNGNGTEKNSPDKTIDTLSNSFQLNSDDEAADLSQDLGFHNPYSIVVFNPRIDGGVHNSVKCQAVLSCQDC